MNQKVQHLEEDDDVTEQPGGAVVKEPRTQGTSTNQNTERDVIANGTVLKVEPLAAALDLMTPVDFVRDEISETEWQRVCVFYKDTKFAQDKAALFKRLRETGFGPAGAGLGEAGAVPGRRGLIVPVVEGEEGPGPEPSQPVERGPSDAKWRPMTVNRGELLNNYMKLSKIRLTGWTHILSGVAFVTMSRGKPLWLC